METMVHECRRARVRATLPAPCAVVRGLVGRLVLLCAVVAAAAPSGAVWAASSNPHGLAVIIGNKSYTGDVPPVDYAHRDAEAFKRYVIDVLGFDPANVIHIEDATRRQMFDVFGSPGATMSDIQARLNLLAPRDGANVVVYYSGHGVPGKEGGASILPANIAPYEAETESYPLALLYEKLGALRHAKTVRVFVEACFSGSSDGGRLEGLSPVYQEAAFPEEVTDNMMILTAVTGKQLATWDTEAGHGLFTHHLLDALYGKGDADGDGEVTAREVKAYLDRYMTSNAWIRNRRHQDAVLTTRALSGLALASAGVGGEFPQRPELSVAGAAESQVAQGEKEEPDAVAAARDKAQPSPEEVESSLALEHGTRRLVQHGLASLGYAPGPADGLFGKRTREAIRRYQEAKGLDATGYLTAAQSQALAAVGEEARARAKAEADRAQAQRRADAERIERERRAKAPGHRFRDCDGTWCPELVVVPAGTFMMGSESEAGRIANEGPRHRVRIAKPFAVGVYEVTFEEWNACRRGGGCTHNPDDEGWGRGRRPVIDVSWEDAQAYVRWLSGETGEGYRLLSESEWEYVARAGTETPFHFGRTISTEQANYNGNFTYGSRRQGEYRERTVAVGGFSPNAFGLHDVHGNVWEWVEDCWNEDYTGAPSNGSSWESGDCSRRVLRGGSWNYGPRLLRSAYRDRYPAGDRGYFVGFRIARTLD